MNFVNYKINNIENDLIKAFKVFDSKDDGTVGRDSLTHNFGQYIDRDNIN